MKYLLDTCVISELIAKQPNEAVVTWVDTLDEGAVYLSAITIGEIQKGIEKLLDSNRKTNLKIWLNDDLMYRFSNRIQPLDNEIMLVWGTMVARLEKEGHPMPAIDSLIAATAIQKEMVLVTRNEKDFSHTGVEILNPWKLSP